MKYFLIAGEASGDQHAAALIEQLCQCDSQAYFAGLGGDRMAAVGCRLYQHIRCMAFMGFAAVLCNIRQIQRNFHIARNSLLKERPDVLILIDYPSFNLRMAAFCKRHLPNTKIYYYIPPKVWAWKKYRIHTIARMCDAVLGIFPFEPDFYAQYGYTCTYVGHPTIEQIPHSKASRTKSLALLPGSRPNEIRHCLPRMLEAARQFSDYTITICAAPNIEDSFFTPYLQKNEKLTRDTYTALRKAAAAIVNSGTATLEAALLDCPQVAVYHLTGSRLISLVRWIQPLMFSIPYFTPVNIITGKETIRECIANEFTVNNVVDELQRLLTDKAYKKEMLASYKHLHTVLGLQSASATAARIITSK